MDAEIRCAFCEQPRPPAQLRREYELDICDPCGGGWCEAALRERGHTLSSREWTTHVRSHAGSYDLHHMSIDACPRDTIDVSAIFTRERIYHKLIKMVRRELEVGDRLFDDFVYIDTRDRTRAHSLLKHAGAQTALMHLVGHCDSVELRRGALQVRHASSEAIYAADVMLATCAFLVHLERSSRESQS
jgi:hypothetical protein